MPAPPPQAETAIIAPTSELIRRVEIFESDGITRWRNGDEDDRLIDGSVSIDYSREERRSIDLTLDNSDFGLEHTPEAFWYDKILKVFCGVRYMDESPVLSNRVRTNLATNPRAVSSSGFTSTSANWTTAYNVSVGSHPLGILTAARSTVANGGAAASHILSMSNIDNMGSTATSRYIGAWVFSSLATTVSLWVAGDQSGTTVTSSVAANTWTFIKTVTPGTGTSNLRMVKATAAVNGETGFVTGVIASTEPITGFFDGAVQNFGNRTYAWSGAANASSSTETTTIADYTPRPAVWETQVGEFMIDNITEDHFPYVVKINGRDYTKLCQKSKFATATMFTKGTPIEDAVKAMAQAAGITRFIIPPTDRILGKDYYFERGVPRWEAMTDISDSFGYELFFDAQGYLVMREFLDPTTSPLIYSLSTGQYGTLVSYSKSVNDTRIYNHVVVTGESTDSAIIPVSAEAINNNPSSPTRIDKLGDRLYTYSSPFITTVAQAQDVANKFLMLHALEEFDLNFSSIALPWLEGGEIIEFDDPRPSPDQPTRFLLSTITVPLGLGAMTGNAKRVSAVG